MMNGFATKGLKALRLGRRPAFARAVLRHRVAAAVEHRYPIEYSGAACVVDIGANKGQFSLACRAWLPDAVIHAFEPLASEADRFERLFENDPKVFLHRVALGEAERSAAFHVASRADSSSLLAPGEGQAQAFGVSSDRVIEVPVKRLDAALDLAALPKPLLVKIDVQGAELEVLKGCRSLDQVDFIYVELSFVELYESQPLFSDVSAFLQDQGFVLVGIFNQVETARFGPTQADFLFRRHDVPQAPPGRQG